MSQIQRTREINGWTLCSLTKVTRIIDWEWDHWGRAQIMRRAFHETGQDGWKALLHMVQMISGRPCFSILLYFSGIFRGGPFK